MSRPARDRGARPFWIELSGENLELGERELASVLGVLAPSTPPAAPLPFGARLREVQLPSELDARDLARRIAFAHRVLVPLSEGPVDLLTEALVMQGATARSARVRLAPGVPAGIARTLPSVLGHAFVQGGGRIDLEHPDRDFLAFVLPHDPAAPVGEVPAALAEVVAEVPRAEAMSRRSKNRPFRKPVTLSPRLARCLVNFAQVPRGGRVLDPFCGTGALLLEAAEMGYRTTGADLEAEMIRGTLTNLESAGFPPEKLVQSSVRELARRLEGSLPFDGVVSDPPYGRASTTGGEGTAVVVEQLLEALPRLLRPGRRAALMLAGPELPELPRGIVLEERRRAERVHRSLTRWLVVLQRQNPETG